LPHSISIDEDHSALGAPRNDADAAASLVCDRFFLGGATDVRGFQYRGIGPRALGDALGGDVYAALGLHLYAPLPFKKWRDAVGNAVKTHFFVTAGSVISSPATSPTYAHLLYRGADALAASTGAGITVLTGAFQLEFNFCYPFKMGQTDRAQKGPQFGVGLTFL
jgi:outer membrane protein insertion porin family